MYIGVYIGVFGGSIRYGDRRFYRNRLRSWESGGISMYIDRHELYDRIYAVFDDDS